MFVIGQTYVRRELHEQCGGQEQSGISTPWSRTSSCCLQGGQGEAFGYLDGWTTDNRYLYTGEGQFGDMRFVRGNLAIRDHVRNGKALCLFEYTEVGMVRYIGEMVCRGYRIRVAPDGNGELRDAIVFELKAVNAPETDAAPEDGTTADPVAVPLEELRERAIAASGASRGDRLQEQTVHDRSEAVRAYVLRRADGVCEACKDAAPFETDKHQPYLEAHHIRSLSDDGLDHPAWVAALCPNCHRRAHYGRDRDVLSRELRNAVWSKELGAA